MTTQKNPMLIPEILLHVNQYLDLPGRVAASQVSHLWHGIFTPGLPSGTVVWKTTLSEAKRNVALEQLCYDNVRTLEAHFQHFHWTTGFFEEDNSAQKQVWEPFKQALLDAAEAPLVDNNAYTNQVSNDNNSYNKRNIRLQKLVICGGITEPDYCPILLSTKTLQHFHIDPTKRVGYGPDLSKLFDILVVPSLQATLRSLTVRYMAWPANRHPPPSNAKSLLAKIVFDTVKISEQHLSSLLSNCPMLQEFVAIDVMDRWHSSILRHLSRANPLLQAFTFSIEPSSTGVECDDAQVNTLIDALTLDLKALGLYRLFCTPSTFERLLARFPNLTRFEILGKSHPACGAMIHHMLCTSPQLLHLKAKDVFIPMALLRDRDDDGGPLQSWVCSSLRTLEISFREHFEAEKGASRSQEDEAKVRADSRVVFAYLVRHVPKLECLMMYKQWLSLRRGDGIDLVKEGLPRLDRLCIISEFSTQIEKDGRRIVSETLSMDRDEEALEELEERLEQLSFRTMADPPR
ncbi:hypothetical protein BGZ72_009346 [Mortierella alpina]|nr:hypothetical protein BGZ72_009346 [Mortierella alpina]